MQYQDLINEYGKDGLCNTLQKMVNWKSILKWTHENGCPWNKLTCSNALQYSYCTQLKRTTIKKTYISMRVMRAKCFKVSLFTVHSY